MYFEVILVDNGSEDGSVEWTKENYPEVRVIVLKENTGFCGGVDAECVSQNQNMYCY